MPASASPQALALRALEGLDACLHLEAMGGTVPLADVYERIVFPATAEEAP